MTGFVQGRELEELYSNAYVYVLPSDIEGMPISLLEAMSYGNCCLISDIYENAEVLGTHGEKFSKSNVNSLYKKLFELIQDKDKVQSYRQNVQDYVLNKYSWDKVVEQTEKLYSKKSKADTDTVKEV